jgi:hypothetical protein
LPAGAVAGAEGAALRGCGIRWPGRLASRGSGAVAGGAGPRVALQNRDCVKAVMRAARGRGGRPGSRFGAGGRGPGRWRPVVRGLKSGSRTVTAARLLLKRPRSQPDPGRDFHYSCDTKSRPASAEAVAQAERGRGHSRDGHA